MVQINFAHKEVNCKIVYYGPGMSGKTTNLEIVHEKAPEENKGELTSISTDGDRTLFFDFMPLDLGTIAGMRTKFQLYTVPGQVYYNSTRKLVLQGVDGVMFIADSDPDKLPENLESYENLIENLKEYGKDIRDLPHVIQYNKRDLPNAMSVADLDKAINRFGVPTFEAVAKTGEGVFPTLKTLAGMVLESINKMEKRSGSAPERPAAPAAQAPAAAARPAPARSAAAPARKGSAARTPAVAATAARAGTAVKNPARRAPQPAQPMAQRNKAPATRPAAPARAHPHAATQAARGQAARPAAPQKAKRSSIGFIVTFIVLLAAAVTGVVLLLTGI